MMHAQPGQQVWRIMASGSMGLRTGRLTARGSAIIILRRDKKKHAEALKEGRTKGESLKVRPVWK